MMDNFRVQHFDPEKLDAVVQVLARAFVTNPINVASLGEDQLAKNEILFARSVPLMQGAKFVALDGDRIVGFMRWVESPGCQLKGTKKLWLVPSMIGAFGLTSALRVASWLSTWSKHDPHEPHLHLGPIGVHPSMHGRGVGRRLMERFCGEIDRTRIPGYLETDRPSNVAFYQHFGFELIHEVDVLGVPNWFMWRPARESPGAS